MRQTVGREYLRPDIEKVERFKGELYSNDTALDYLLITRGLTMDTIKHFELGYDSTKNAISIPVFKGSVLVNIKYRFLEPKDIKYVGERGAENWMYNDAGIEVGKVKGGVLIVEGEFDLMSCYQAGIKNVVSPAGGKDSYGPWIELLDSIPRVYIAYDNDEPGRDAGRKFAERIGSDKCYEVKYPEGIKDANEYFKTHTVEEYKQSIKGASPYYSYQFKNIGDIIFDLRKDDFEEVQLNVIPGVKIGKDWLIVVSGRENIGKTTYSMNIATELAERGIPSLIMPFERGISTVGRRFLQVYFNKSQEDFKFTPNDEWEKMIDKAVEVPVYFSLPKREDIRDIVIKSKRLFDTKFVIIDHLDYAVRNVGGNKESEIANTLQAFKSIGIEYGIVFIVVTHIKKIDQPGSSVRREPGVEDLKGSSSLYQDPECVVFLNSDEAGTLKVKIAKNKGEMGEKVFSVKEGVGRLSEYKNDW